MSNFTVNLPTISDKEFKITDFGAVGDGITNNTIDQIFTFFPN